mmetsp:Transcript_32228/g.82482  ORF Transcript_32228/g.82482 Transcript_32228/m.82482 type:complete len:150 (-) Transcript_32228:156-605(-)|eukprot:jgi/Tetstr1/464601/TSEL_009356.t1
MASNSAAATWFKSRETTAPGHNKNLRVIARGLLMATAALLLLAWPFAALLTCLAACLTLHDGTPYSVKNITWTLLSWATLLGCIFAGFARYSADNVDEEKAYALKTTIVLMARGTELLWSAITGLCLFNAWLTANNLSPFAQPAAVKRE